MKTTAKTLLLKVLMAFVITSQLIVLNAQPPQAISYQAIARNAQGAVLVNQNVSLRFSILQGSVSGNAVYSETHNVTTNEFGLVNLKIGMGTPVSGLFSSIDWAAGSYFAKVDIDITGASNYSEVGISEILSVPYALHAKTADMAANQIGNGATVGQILFWDGTVWQLLNPGTAGQVLKINDSGIPAWQNASTPSLLPPSIISVSTSDLTSISAKINITANANGFFSHCELEIGLTTDYEFTFKNDDWEFEFSGNDDFSKSYVINQYSYGGDDYQLQPATTYHYRIWIENAVNTTYSEDMTFTTLPLPEDLDGNAYNVVRIGNQIWMKENLKTTKFSNGDPIPNVTNQTEWGNLTTGAWCFYNNESSNGDIYGRMYNYYAVADPRGLCPTGWHVPSEDEWSVLIELYGGEDEAGGALKDGNEGYDPEYYYGYWAFPNTGATNESGFSALPGGNRYPNAFHSLGIYGDWWTSTEYDADNALLKNMFYHSTVVGDYYGTKKFGFSVRCLKNAEGVKANTTLKPNTSISKQKSIKLEH